MSVQFLIYFCDKVLSYEQKTISLNCSILNVDYDDSLEYFVSESNTYEILHRQTAITYLTNRQKRLWKMLRYTAHYSQSK